MARINSTSKKYGRNRAVRTSSRLRYVRLSNQRVKESLIRRSIATMSIDDLADASEMLSLKSECMSIKYDSYSGAARKLVAKAVNDNSVRKTLADVNKQIVAKIGLRG